MPAAVPSPIRPILYPGSCDYSSEETYNTRQQQARYQLRNLRVGVTTAANAVYCCLLPGTILVQQHSSSRYDTPGTIMCNIYQWVVHSTKQTWANTAAAVWTFLYTTLSNPGLAHRPYDVDNMSSWCHGKWWWTIWYRAIQIVSNELCAVRRQAMSRHASQARGEANHTRAALKEEHT